MNGIYKTTAVRPSHSWDRLILTMMYLNMILDFVCRLRVCVSHTEKEKKRGRETGKEGGGNRRERKEEGRGG